MEVTVIGSGTAVPTASRGQPAIMVRGEEESFILDLGAGSLRGVVKAGADPREIDYFLLSHMHLDHVADLPVWLFAFRNPEFCRVKPIIIGGSEKLASHLENLRVTYGKMIIPSAEIIIFDLLKESLPSREFEIEAHHVVHTDGSLGYRIAGKKSGKVLAYSGDAEFSQDLIDLGRGADLLILESSFPDGSSQPGHLCPGEALRVGRECGCRKLMLTHFYQDWDPRSSVAGNGEKHPFEVIIAEDGLTIRP